MADLTQYASNKNQVLMVVRSEFAIPYFKVSLEKYRGRWCWSGHIARYFNNTDTGVLKVSALTLAEWVDLFRRELDNALCQHNITHDALIEELLGIQEIA